MMVDCSLSILKLKDFLTCHVRRNQSKAARTYWQFLHFLSIETHYIVFPIRLTFPWVHIDDKDKHKETQLLSQTKIISETVTFLAVFFSLPNVVLKLILLFQVGSAISTLYFNNLLFMWYLIDEAEKYACFIIDRANLGMFNHGIKGMGQGR